MNHFFKMFEGCFKTVVGFAASRIEMASPVEMGAGKSITIKVTFAAEAPFSFFVPVNHNAGQFYALDAQGIIDQTLRIAGFYLVAEQILLCYPDERRV